MQGSDEWHVNNIMGQDVHTKPPYPGIGRCSVKLYPCPFPVSANDVSMSPVVVPGRDAALMEFEEGSTDFLPARTPIPFSVASPFIQLASSLEESSVSDLSLNEGDEADVNPSQTGVCDIVSPLVVWEELFNASEAYFADGGGDTDSGEAPVEEVPVGESSVGDVSCMVKSSWGSVGSLLGVDARVVPLRILGVVVALCTVSMIVVSLFMFVGGVVFGG